MHQILQQKRDDIQYLPVKNVHFKIWFEDKLLIAKTLKKEDTFKFMYELVEESKTLFEKIRSGFFDVKLTSNLSEYQKEYYQKNKEKLLQKKKERYKDNSKKTPEEKKEYYKEWSKKNKEKMKKYNREYRQKNKDAINKRLRDKKKNPDK
jgi:hypothetical protein